MRPFANNDRDADGGVDARGLRCPLPLIRLQQHLESRARGDRAWLLADDPGVEDDLPPWCEATGHRLLAIQPQDGGAWLAWIEKT